MECIKLVNKATGYGRGYGRIPTIKALEPLRCRWQVGREWVNWR
jgi:hypothetical protein